MAKEASVSSLGFGPLELVADNPADWQTALPSPFLKPVGELGRKTNGDCVTHQTEE
jgi:hypothetical protein